MNRDGWDYAVIAILCLGALIYFAVTIKMSVAAP
jgi:hypothetical protein